MFSIKSLAESTSGLTTIPSNYTFIKNPQDQVVVEDLELPIIDFSLLNSDNHDQRSNVINNLGKACKDWGFFVVINHGLSERLMVDILSKCKEFFDLTEKEKKEFEGKHVMDPIRCGTSFNSSVEKVFFWRDFLKVFVHPQFHFPNKPSDFRELAFEYCQRTREVARRLLEGISESLGLEGNYIDKVMNLETGFQIFIANMYPTCPQPELAMGLPPHSDHGLLTLLTQNGCRGLQIQHNGNWVNINSPPNSFLVNIGDHLEILSNGKYKSVVHRAVVNKNATRISLAIAHGSSLETVVTPAPKLVDASEQQQPIYVGMKYKDYIHLQQSNNLNNKFCLDHVRF